MQITFDHLSRTRPLTIANRFKPIPVPAMHRDPLSLSLTPVSMTWAGDPLSPGSWETGGYGSD